MKVIDLTHTIRENMPVYPGTEPPKLSPTSSYESDGFKETLLQMYTHTGTHMDPPAHIFSGRTTLDEFPVDQFIGKALVIDCRELKEGQAITMDCIRRAGEKAEQADFLLFCTEYRGNSVRTGEEDWMNASSRKAIFRVLKVYRR